MKRAQMLSVSISSLVRFSKAPDRVGGGDAVAVVRLEAAIELDHAFDEARRKDADAAVVEEVDAGRPAVLLEDRVVAEMRVAVDHAEMREGPPPGLEQRRRDAVALLQRMVDEGEQRLALEPASW